MHPSEIILYLSKRGFSVDFVKELATISIYPAPDQQLASRILARESDLLSYFRTLDARPATGHKFVVDERRQDAIAEIQKRGVCIACGVPWASHGEPPVDAWRFVPNVITYPVLSVAPVHVQRDVAAAVSA